MDHQNDRLGRVVYNCPELFERGTLKIGGVAMANSLSPEIESFIQQEVALGTYQDRDDAIEAGIELLRQRKALLDRLDESRRQLDEGEYEEYDDEGLRQLFEQLIARADNKKPQ
jgi:Arc/MetJ-type ribon-helix-helix transcriptional regulator